jgi:hypothetical protein
MTRISPSLLTCASPPEEETREDAQAKAPVTMLADAEAARRVKGRRIARRIAGVDLDVRDWKGQRTVAQIWSRPMEGGKWKDQGRQ